jgi:hypothetical protein
MNAPIEISRCRACSSLDLTSVMSLGNQSLSGVFPIIGEQDPMYGPLELLYCSQCSLIQLKHNFPADLMYGENYGYRSGLNQSMVDHLSRKANFLFDKYCKEKKASVLDIGSNDGTLLNSLKNKASRLIGMDPTSLKFIQYYDQKIEVISDFFSAEQFLKISNNVDLVFSISMFYDLDDPVSFASQVEQVLAPDGVWHLEQSYAVTMMDSVSYDTICHEHVEYYTVSSIEYILSKVGLKIIDVEINDVNGGSIAITAAKQSSKYQATEMVHWIKRYELIKISNPLEALDVFSKNTVKHKEYLIDLLETLKKEGKKVWGLGASTKGNVLLQYCGITTDLVEKIVEVNPYKFGRWTPSTHIPIVDESEMNSTNVDYAFVLPWHFKSTMISKSREFIDAGGKLIFPLPQITIS